MRCDPAMCCECYPLGRRFACFCLPRMTVTYFPQTSHHTSLGGTRLVPSGREAYNLDVRAQHSKSGNVNERKSPLCPCRREGTQAGVMRNWRGSMLFFGFAARSRSPQGVWTESLGEPTIYLDYARANVARQHFKSAARNIRRAAAELSQRSQGA